MKELSIEEKAKRYDEVREKIAIRFGSNVADEIFSQLEMSEDERVRKAIVIYLKSVIDCKEYRDEIIESWIAWLEKQGETSPVLSNSSNIGKSAWSEEDEKMLKAIHNSVDVECLSKNGLDYVVMVDWFNSLKDRVQPKQEWSMYDETILKNLIDHFEYKKEFNEAEDYDIVLWLKSLRPQNRWKPSDEQMKVLKILTDTSKGFDHSKILESLYNDLKKLKDE